MCTVGLIAAPVHHDLLITGGTVIDGAGNPGIRADVAVDGDTITAIGPMADALTRGEIEADTVIDATGRVVCPGFIDPHTHADSSLLENRLAENFIRDGVTTLITGNCGGNHWPVAEFLASAEEGGIAPNIATLVGHNTVRRRVIGREDRDPTAEQLASMEALVDQAMREGAMGLSTGLIYIPGTYSETEEIIALARVVARHGGLYATHMRSETEEIFSAIEEALRIGREANVPVHISHFKVRGHAMFEESAYPLINDLLGSDYEPGAHVPAASRATLALVMRARAQGQDVTLDQYPYPASSTGLGVMIPDWLRAEGDDHAVEILADPETRARVRDEIAERYRGRGLEDLDWAQIASCESDPSLNGLSIRDVTIRRGTPEPTLEDDTETVIDLFMAGGAGMIFHSQSEDDVMRIMRCPIVGVCSDSSVRRFGSGVPHPRGYGSNARVLARYVRGLHNITLEEAIRKMTSLNAQRFALRDRGLLREGMRADIVVFNPRTVTDRATFTDPHQHSEGFDAVIVNGEPVVLDDEVTRARPGRALRGQGFWASGG
ncbi:D-aminoacylase [Candidatus Sumerlaeota bacterium]|nr:D-aminoacylase [Candidatus Sumerlaeota bacterium]